VNFADESACLMDDSIWCEVVTIHRSQVVLKMVSSLHIDFYAIVSLKNTGTTILLTLTAHQTPTFTGWFSSCVAILALDFDTSVS
jgi:hypothetical protein